MPEVVLTGAALLRATLRRLTAALRANDGEDLVRTGALIDVLIAEQPERAIVVLETLLLSDDAVLPAAARSHLAEAARAVDAAPPDAAATRALLAALWRTLARPSEPRPAVLATVIEEYLATHLDGRARLGDLARKLGYSPSHLSTLIRRATGRSFVALRRRLRFERACALLRGGASVKEAALAAGFDDPAYFSRLFKGRVGIAPSRWRADVMAAAGRGEPPSDGDGG